MYAATQDAFSRRVALKVLNSAADGDSIRRFTRECSAAGALSWHPNIVVVFDAGVTDEGAPFIAEHIIRVTERAFDDFADAGTDEAANRRMLGIG